MVSGILKLALRYFRSRVRFPYVRGGEAMKTIGGVLDAFEAGYLAALDGRAEAMDRAVASFPWYQHEFVHEGAATALAGKHCLSFSRGNPDRRRLSDRYRRMYYTGYGFWNGLGRVYPLPALSLEARTWNDVPDFAELGPLIPGGIAFSVVGVLARFDRSVLAKLTIPDHPGWQEATLHGCGRALWFLAMDNVPKIEEIVGGFPDISEHLLAGVGIAIGFTQIYRPDNILRTLDSFSREEYRSTALKGAAVALASMPLDNPNALPRVEEAAVGPLRPVYKRITEAMRTVAPGAHWYGDLVNRVRQIQTAESAVSG